MNRTDTSLSKMTIFLHWIVGIGIIAMIAVGIYMDEAKVRSLYPIHKSVGIILFIFIIYRAARRLIRGWPEHVAEMTPVETLVAKTVLWVLLIGSILFPLSGMMMSAAGGHGLSVFGLELLAPNVIDGKAVELNKTLHELGEEMHGTLPIIMIIAISLHLLASLKHHFINKDATLRRMLGKK